MRDYPFFWKLLVLSKFTVLIYQLKHIQLVLQSNKRFRDQCSTINSKKISVAWGRIWMPCFPLISFATLLVKNITGLDEHLCLTSFGHSEETIQFSLIHADQIVNPLHKCWHFYFCGAGKHLQCRAVMPRILWRGHGQAGDQITFSQTALWRTGWIPSSITCTKKIKMGLLQIMLSYILIHYQSLWHLFFTTFYCV